MKKEPTLVINNERHVIWQSDPQTLEEWIYSQRLTGQTEKVMRMHRVFREKEAARKRKFGQLSAQKGKA